MVFNIQGVGIGALFSNTAECF